MRTCRAQVWVCDPRSNSYLSCARSMFFTYKFQEKTKTVTQLICTRQPSVKRCNANSLFLNVDVRFSLSGFCMSEVKRRKLRIFAFECVTKSAITRVDPKARFWVYSFTFLS